MEIEVNLGGDDVILDVSYLYHLGYDGSAEEPPEEEEVEILSIKLDGVEFECEDSIIDYLVGKILEHEHSMKDYWIGG